MPLKGRVLKTTGSLSEVQLDGGKMVTCRVKGKLRIGGVTTTNPVVVGDRVSVELEAGDATITEVDDRRNYIVRESPRRKMQRHVLAANVDQCMLITTLVEPDFKPGFADRFLATSEAYHIPAVIVFNKEDLWSEGDRAALESRVLSYRNCGYEVLSVSAETGSNLEVMNDMLRERSTLLAGQSGVGKSSIVNRLIPGLDLKTADLSSYSGKGIHTTTFAAMFPLPGGGFIIDTPGVKEWSLADMLPEELGQYLPEFRKAMENCRFKNCLHVDEPHCAVKEAVQAGRISLSRYESYLMMLDELKQLNRWEVGR